jgi:Winged helix DNA-binding domain
MTHADLLRRRLRTQHVTGASLTTPEQVVGWLGAVQAQDYAAARWALALRAKNVTETAVDDALASGAILRTHVLRPTWHFVVPDDIRWMLRLTAPRVNVAMAYFYRTHELDDRLVAKSHAVLRRVLHGGRQLTRRALASALEKARIIRSKDSPLRVFGLLLRAELDALVCSGARVGSQFTYALLDDRVPPGRTLPGEEARAELVRRYFVSHGPATLRDFRWWSGLTAADARHGLEAVESQLDRDVIDGKVFWRGPNTRPRAKTSMAAHLLPIYDECLLSYRDGREHVADHAHQGIFFYGPAIVMDGRIVGAWKRTLSGTSVVLEAVPFAPLGGRETSALTRAVRRYGRFMERESFLVLRPRPV